MKLKQRELTSVSSDVFVAVDVVAAAPSTRILIYIYIYIYIVARFNSSRVDSTYECQTPQNATLTDQERQEDVQLKVC